MADNGIIDARAATDIWTRLSYLYHRTAAPVLVSVVQGKFY
jgi:hypothetical protein